jgi:hypothetical protein
MKEPLINTVIFEEKRADGTVYYYAVVAIAVKKNFWNRLVWKKHLVFETDNHQCYLREKSGSNVGIRTENLEITTRKTREAIDNWMKSYLRSKIISISEL